MGVDHHSETLLNRYADGEASSADQAELFAHLSKSDACRSQFNVLLAFSLASRQEVFDVPPGVDEAIFARFNRIRRAPRQTPGRISERGFFGRQVHGCVPLLSPLLAAVILIVFGLSLRLDSVADISDES